jgi:hypothetical protein
VKNNPCSTLERTSVPPDEIGYVFDAICASAVMEVICSAPSSEIAEARARARRSGVAFLTVPHPELLLSCGRTEPSRQLHFRAVSVDEFVKFVHSFVKPPKS